MRDQRSIAPAALGCLLGLLGCGTPTAPSGVEFDLQPPELGEITVVGGKDAASPTASIRVPFSEPLAAERLVAEAVALVPFAVSGPCSVDLACGPGRCHRGRCQRDVADHAWLQDLARPPLSRHRREQVVPVEISLQQHGRVLLVRAREPLDTYRLHRLLLSPSISDLAGNPLAVDPDGVELPGALFATGGPELAGPRVTLVSPADGDTDLPTNLQRIVLRASRAVRGLSSEAVVLQGESGARVGLSVSTHDSACGPGLGAGRCFVGQVSQPLRPLTEWTLLVSPAVVDELGRGVFSERIGSFASAGAADERAPAAVHSEARVADGCVLLRIRADEPTDLRLWRDGRAGVVSVGEVDHELAWPLPPATKRRLPLQLFDLAGNAAGPRTLAVVSERTAALQISEVLADPAGPEPQQEFVEIRNRSSEEISLAGWVLDDNDDGRGANELPDVRLAAGAYAVVVGQGYDLSLPDDPPPAAGATLVRVAGTIGERGLANRGESLVLRDPAGVLVSRYPGAAGAGQVAANGQSRERARADACGTSSDWRANALGRSTPGRSPDPWPDAREGNR